MKSYKESRQAFLDWAKANNVHPTSKRDFRFGELTKNFFSNIFTKKNVDVKERKVINGILTLIIIVFLTFFIFWLGFNASGFNLFIITVFSAVLPLMFNLANEHARYVTRSKGLFLKAKGYTKLDPKFRAEAAYAYYENRQVIFLFWLAMNLSSISYLAFHYVSLALILGIVLTVLCTVIAYKLSDTNIMFTKVKEAHAVIVMRGSQFRKVEIAFRGRYLDSNNEVVPSIEYVPDIPKANSVVEKIISFLSPGGLRFLGLPSDKLLSISTIKKDIITNEQNNNERERFAITEVKNDFTQIPLNIQTMGLWIIRAETLEKVTVEALFIIYYYISNPVKYAFKALDFEKAVYGIIDPFLRQLIAKEPIKKLFEDRNYIKRKIQSTRKNNTNSLGKIDEDYGVTIISPELWNLDPTKPETVTALELPWMSSQKQQGILIDAETEKQRIQKIYAELNSIESGKEIFATEALKEMGKSGNSMLMLPIDSLTNALKAFKGGK